MINIPKTIAIWLIIVYQKTVSPDHGLFRARWPHGFCRFYPSCSEYAKQAIEMHGLIRGAILGAKRVARCNPFVQPAVDPVPHS